MAFAHSLSQSTMLWLVLALALTFPVPVRTQGLFRNLFRSIRSSSQCPSSDQCGVFGGSSLLRNGTFETAGCVESCPFFRTPGLTCGGCGTLPPTPSRPTVPTAPVPAPPPVAPAAPPPGATGQYSISLDLVGIPLSNRAYFTDAKARWEKIVMGDVSDFPSASLSRGPAYSGCVYPTVIDDLYICAVYTAIDGAGTILASSGPILRRKIGGTDSGLTITGAMRFDSADLGNLQASGDFGAVILHEMGHIIGR